METTFVTMSNELSSKGRTGSALRSLTTYSSTCSFRASSSSFMPSATRLPA